MNRNAFILSLIFILPAVLNAEEPATQSQQKAVSHLVQALKSIRLAIMSGSGETPGAGKPGQDKTAGNPFRSKEKFKLPEMPPKENVHNQLSELSKEQKQLNSEVRKNTEGTSEKLVEKQDSLREKLDAVRKKLSDNKPAAEKLANSDEKMKDASDYLKAEKRLPASVKGEQAAADLEQARKKLEKDSNQETAKKLEETGKKLDHLSEELKDGKHSSKQTLDELSEMASDLAKEAGNQHKTGTQGNAERLGKVGERMNEAADSGPDSKLPEAKKKEELLQALGTLKKVVTAARSGQQDPVSFLSSTLSRLNENTDYLRYLKKHPDPAAEQEVRKEMDSLLEDLSSIVGRIAEESADWNVVKAREAVEKELTRYGKNVSGSPEKMAPLLDLAGKLLLALKRAKKTAQNISCLNNTKTIMSGMIMYADTYHYFVPRAGPAASGPFWHDRIYEILSGKDMSLLSPSVYKAAPYYRCPVYRFPGNPNYNTFAYGKNDNLGGPGTTNAAKPGSVRLPSLKIAIGDSFDAGRYGQIIAPSGEFLLGNRHDAKASVAFVDGHAESLFSNKYAPVKIQGQMDYLTGANLLRTEGALTGSASAFPLFIRQAWGCRGVNYDNMTGDGSIF